MLTRLCNLEPPSSPTFIEHLHNSTGLTLLGIHCFPYFCSKTWIVGSRSGGSSKKIVLIFHLKIVNFKLKNRSIWRECILST